MQKSLVCWSIFVLITAISCQKEKARNPFGRHETITVAWSKDVNTLDPACAVGMESAEVVAQMYEGLVTTDLITHQIRPLLAEKWEQSADGLVWDFTLRPGLSFHDGTPVDAEAVVFSFRRQMDAVIAHRTRPDDPRISICGYDYWKAYFDGLIQSVKVINSLKLRIVLKYPYAPFLNSLEMFAVSVVRPFDTENMEMLNQRSLGTGPFKLVSRTPDRIVLTRHTGYWNPSKIPSYKYLVFQTIRETRQRLLALEGQRIDFAYHLNPARYLTIQLHPLLQLRAESSNNTVYLALNTKRGPFSVRQIRLAVSHAINRDKIVKMVYQGMADLAQGPLSGQMLVQGKPIFQENDPLARWHEHDQEKARALLREGGFGLEGGQRPLTLYLIQSPRNYLPDPMLMANMIRHDLEQVGIPVVVKPAEYMEYKRILKLGLHDMAIHGWVGEISDPDEYLFGLLHGSNVTRATGTNHAFFTNDRFDDLVKRARQAHESADQRISLCRQAMEIFRHEAPWVPLAHSRMVVTASKRLTGIEVTPATFLVYRNLRVVEK
jgi:peptide/nickel transport system substrate-binding protein